MEKPPLQLKFEPQTIEHLGSRMYSHLPNAIAELVANAYDANANEVTITINGLDGVTVHDDGHGMSREDLQNRYLRIGRNRRKEEDSNRTEGGLRPLSGKKGLGKLALFGIGRQVTLRTKRENAMNWNVVEISYDDMLEASGTYTPTERTETGEPAAHGTSVTLTRLKRKTEIAPKKLAISLARLFDYQDDDFRIVIVSGDKEFKVTPDLRLQSVDSEFSWKIPEDLKISTEFLREKRVSGHIVTSKKPLPPGLRGVVLYSNGRMVNEAEFFDNSDSSYAFAYMTGIVNADFLDELTPDVIATDRRAIDWETDETSQLRDILSEAVFEISRGWRNLRQKKAEETADKSLDTPVQKWISTIESKPERQAVERLSELLNGDESDIPPNERVQILKETQIIAPPYADYAWRHLHPEIQDATREEYRVGDYYHAVENALRRFMALLRDKTGNTSKPEKDLINAAFGREDAKRLLSVFSRYRSLALFTDDTSNSIEDGQRSLAAGAWEAFRNPLAHNEATTLQKTGAFTYEDCLDALALLSHLTRRLDDSTPWPTTS